MENITPNFALRPHQELALSNISSARKNGKNSYLVVRAPSMGKTLIGIFDVKKYRDEQLQLGKKPRFLILNGNRDILIMLRNEFFRVFGTTVTYGNYWSGDHFEGQPDFVFATFASIYRNLANFKKDEFAYLLIDEAHHSMARTHRAVINYFNCDFKLGLTATPVRSDGKQIAEEFGEVRDAIELPEALARGDVASVEYFLMLDDFSPLAEILEEEGIHFTISELNKRIFAPRRDEEIVRLIEENSKKKKNPKTLVFCPSIEHANRISALMENSTVVHSRIDSKKCSERLDAFKHGDFRTIVSVDKLNEGIDIPSADVIVFLRSTVSQVVYYQQLGRGLRTYEGKDSVLVLDFVANCERLLMIESLRDKYMQADQNTKSATTHRHPHEKKQHFQLNITTPTFRSRYVDIVQKLLEAKKKLWTDEEILSSIKRLTEELSHSPTIEEINSCPYLPSSGTIAHHFGSTDNVKKLLGLESNRHVWTREEVIEFLQSMGKSSGRAPSVLELEKIKGAPCHKTVEKLFGSWNAALIAAGFTPYSVRIWTEEEVIVGLQKLAKELGRTPVKEEAKKCPYLPTERYFVQHFGSWNNALIAAGLTPRKPGQTSRNI